MAKGGITLSAQHGTIVNDMTLVAGGDILLKSKSDIENASGIYSLNGNIGLYSYQGKVTNTSNSTTAQFFKGKEVYAPNGSVTIYAGLNAVNEASINAGKEVILYADGTYNYVLKEGSSWEMELDEKGNALFQAGSFTNGTVVNGMISANSNAISNDSDTKSIQAGEGGIFIAAQNEVTNGAILASDKGDVVVTSFRSSVTNNEDATISTQVGNVIMEAEGDVYNKGDFYSLNLEKDQGNSDKGWAKIISYNGDIRNENEWGKDDAAGVQMAEGGVELKAENGSLYNEKSLYAAQTIEIECKGDIIINTSDDYGSKIDGIVVYEKGDINLKSGGAIINNGVLKAVDGDVTLIAQGSKEVPIAGGTAPEASIILFTNVEANNGRVDIKGDANAFIANVNDASTISAKTGVTVEVGGSLTICGDISCSEGSVLIGAEGNAYVGNDSDITAENALVGIGNIGLEDNGKILVNGTIKGKKVAYYTEGEETDFDISKAKTIVGEELILASNSWNGGKAIDMSTISSENPEGYVLSIFGVGSEDGKASGSIKLDFPTDKPVIVHCLCVENMEISSQGTINIEHLSVGDKGEVIMQGEKTSIYGTMHAYDAESDEIYYNEGGGGANINLHELFFAGRTSEGKRRFTEDKQEYAKALMDDTSAFVNGRYGEDALNGEMFLNITSPNRQESNGLLLKKKAGFKAYTQRFSAENLMQHQGSQKAREFYNAYFDTGMQFFNRYNVIEIPDVIVNVPGLAINEDKEKELEFEF